MTELGHKVARIKETEGRVPSISEMKRDSLALDLQYLNALRSAWPELSQELKENQARDTRRTMKLVSSTRAEIRLQAVS